MMTSFGVPDRSHAVSLSFSGFTARGTPKRRSFTNAQRMNMAICKNWTCAGCKRHDLYTTTGWDIDHVIELADGGEDDAANMQLLCATCHADKTRLNAMIRAGRKRTFSQTSDVPRNDAEVSSGAGAVTSYTANDKVRRDIDEELSIHRRNNDTEFERHRVRMLVLTALLPSDGEPSKARLGDRVATAHVGTNTAHEHKVSSSTPDVDEPHAATTNATTCYVSNDSLLQLFEFTGREDDYVLYHEIWVTLRTHGLTVGAFDVLKGLKIIGGIGSGTRKRTRGGKQDRYLLKIKTR